MNVLKDRFLVGLIFICGLVLIGCGGGSSSGDSSSVQPGFGSQLSGSGSKPNILFVIMDDVGIDQMAIFGYDQDNQPILPNINAVATAGIRFRNHWSMPECSPGRAAMFTGRYPLRTGNGAALGENDLANSQITQYEMAIPKLLKGANYENGLFGKFHLGGPENNQNGSGAPFSLGWDYFFGNVGLVGPSSIDQTAGGVGGKGSGGNGQTYGCGFIPGPLNGGAASGACYFVDKPCKSISSGGALLSDSAGMQCVTQGGIFKPGTSCQTNSTPPEITAGFSNPNAYYADTFTINDSSGKVTVLPPSDPKTRGYRTTIEANAAIAWIKSRNPTKPWMATVSFSAAHTPLQQAPAALTPNTKTSGDSLSCTNPVHQRILQNQMTEAMDTEFGRILVETGLATRNADGTLNYNPSASNTMIVIVGDNGTLGPSVKLPFNPFRAKGTAYQTGVWTPLIVAGPSVSRPNRDVEHMTNMVDVFKLFADFAGIDANAKVPRTIDSAPLAGYLSNPSQSSIRNYNFTQGFQNIQANNVINSPCVISNGCSHAAPTKKICEDNSGVWWGAGYTDSAVIPEGTSNGKKYGFNSVDGYPGVNGCAYVQQAKYLTGKQPIIFTPYAVNALRNKDYKLVRNTTESYNAQTNEVGTVEAEEFYMVNQDPGNQVLLDNSRNNYLDTSNGLTWSTAAQNAYKDLSAKLTQMLASQPDCIGDGNKDGIVDAIDSDNMQMTASTFSGISSTYDLNLDGKTIVATDGPLMKVGACQKSSTFY
jgi:hypothetical protein